MEGTSITSLFENEGWLGVDVAAGVAVGVTVGEAGVGVGSGGENMPHASKVRATENKQSISELFLSDISNTPFLKHELLLFIFNSKRYNDSWVVGVTYSTPIQWVDFQASIG
jgi:hypothetical protein